MIERDVEAYLVARAKALGGEVRKVQWVGRRGAPDRLVMLPSSASPWAFSLAAPLERTAIPERDIEGDLVACAKALGGEVQWVGRRATIWVEVKAPGEKVKPHQAREHARMRCLGQRVEVVDSFDQVDEVLR